MMEDKPVKTATENMLDDYEEIIRRPVLDDQAKEEAAKLEESLVKEFHTLGGEDDLDSLQAAYSRLEKLAEENPFTKLRLGWVRNRAKSDYAYVLSISAALTSKKESLRLFEELALSSPSHKGYADNVRIIKKQIADYYLRMGEKGDFGSAIYAEKLYRELAEQNPDRKYEEFINKAKSLCDETKLVPGVGPLPYPAYHGKEPYIFISYARLDSERVFAEIKRFNEAGFHVWYDEGIAPGNEWSEAIAEALSNCSVFVVLLTPTSAPRENVLNEIDYALNEQKPFLAIHLEETTLPPGLRLRISRKQAILKYNMSEEEYEYKYIEAFTRFGLKRNEKASPAVNATQSSAPSATSSGAATPSPKNEEVYDDSPEDAKKRANGDLVRVDGFDIEHGLLRGYYGTDKNITVPRAAKIIGASSFDGCRLFIESVDLNQAGKIIAGPLFGGFRNCPNLKTVKIPETVGEVRPEMFHNCPNLTIYVHRRQLSPDFEKHFTGKDIIYLDE